MTRVQQQCLNVSDMVAEARLNYPAIRDRADEPGFIGGEEEAGLIRDYIDAMYDSGQLFERWRLTRRANLTHVSPSGVDLTNPVINFRLFFNGVLVND